MLVAKPDDRITMEEIFRHPWLNEDLKLPFIATPYPCTMRMIDMKESIIEHMTLMLMIGTPLGIKQDLISNKATSLYAIYHLLSSRLIRYEKCSMRVTRTHDKRTKKVSKDLGFFEDDADSDVASSTSTITTTSSIGKKSGVS